VVEFRKGPFEEGEHVKPSDSQRGARGDDKKGMACRFRLGDSGGGGRKQRMGDGDGEEIASQGNERGDFSDQLHRCVAGSPRSAVRIL